MANWVEYIGKALNHLKRKSKTPSLPQLAPGFLAVPEKIEISSKPMRKREKQVKESLPYRLFEKMRRRSLSWKSYYYQNEYGIVDIAISNDDATGIHINERRCLVDEERVVEGTFYTDEEASVIYLSSEYLDNVPQDLFNKLVENEVSFLSFDKTYPLEILFHSDMDEKKGLFFLGHHKIHVKDEIAYLLRPFRNLGASGFYALTNQMLIQENIPVDKKSFVESLLIELGDDELLKSYQSALNLYNRQLSIREIPTIPEDDDIPLIITKAKESSRTEKDSRSSDALAKQPPIPYESYELFAKLFERNFEELEDDLLKISMAATELNRAKVSDELSILSDKLRQYTKEALLDDMGSAKLYNFMERFSINESESEDFEKSKDYSLLEDEAYEQILIEIMESIEEICSNPRYFHYAPIKNKLDGLMETIESLYTALQDAYDKHKRREIDDKREILLKKPFELNNSYDRDLEEDELSFYDKLLEVNETVNTIKEQMKYAAYDVAKDLAFSGYMLAQLKNVNSAEFDQLSSNFLELIERRPSDDYASFETDFVQELALIVSEIHEILNEELSEKLTIACANLASFQTSGEIYSEQEWPADYTDFIANEAISFSEEVKEMATEKQEKIREKILYQHKLVDIFIGGVSYPALLPATLHEEGKGLQTYLVQYLQEYLATQDLQLHTVPGREKQLRSLINELMPVRLDKPLKKLEYYFRLNTA